MIIIFKNSYILFYVRKYNFVDASNEEVCKRHKIFQIIYPGGN